MTQYFNTLSGRFVLITFLFVLSLQILVFLPFLVFFRLNFLQERLEYAQIAALSRLATDAEIDSHLERELLENAQVYNVVLHRDMLRELVLSSPLPQAVSHHYDLRKNRFQDQVWDAISAFSTQENEIIRVIGYPSNDAGTLIEITMETKYLQNAMRRFRWRFFLISAVLSIAGASVLFFFVRYLLMQPTKKLLNKMSLYAKNPQDQRLFIMPSARLVELHEAEKTMHSLQEHLTAALQQKERLAQLGGAVAKISHDLRNILASAQLFADRLEFSDDPMVQRSAPKLIRSITRASTLCENTLAFGKLQENPPNLTRFPIEEVVQDVFEAETLLCRYPLVFTRDIENGLHIRADKEQLFRILVNLVRNARQGIESTGKSGTIHLHAHINNACLVIQIRDTGPGMPQKAQEHIFSPFKGNVRQGGTGLGLAIVAELVQGHGGKIRLLSSDKTGTTFEIVLPQENLRFCKDFS